MVKMARLARFVFLVQPFIVAITSLEMSSIPRGYASLEMTSIQQGYASVETTSILQGYASIATSCAHTIFTSTYTTTVGTTVVQLATNSACPCISSDTTTNNIDLSIEKSTPTSQSCGSLTTSQVVYSTDLPVLSTTVVNDTPALIVHNKTTTTTTTTTRTTQLILSTSSSSSSYNLCENCYRSTAMGTGTYASILNQTSSLIPGVTESTARAQSTYGSTGSILKIQIERLVSFVIGISAAALWVNGIV